MVAHTSVPRAVGDVTLVLCTRNGHSRGFLDEAIRSVLQQTVVPAEIFLVDDGSTDDTVAEVRRKFPDVTILNNAGTGLAAARNTGVRAAHRTWVAFLDDDDVWCPGKLAEQLKLVSSSARPQATICAARVCFIGADGSTLPTAREATHMAGWPAVFLGGSPIYPSGALFSRGLFSRVGAFREDMRFGAAFEFWVRCLAAGAALHFSENVLVHHRRHSPQMTDVSAALFRGLQSIDAALLPHLRALPPALAARLQTARFLLRLRSSTLHQGFASTARFWANSSLRPSCLNLRACIWFLLDTAVCRAPDTIKQFVRQATIKFLVRSFETNQSNASLLEPQGTAGVGTAVAQHHET